MSFEGKSTCEDLGERDVRILLVQGSGEERFLPQLFFQLFPFIISALG
jgi:hypothetical protein